MAVSVEQVSAPELMWDIPRIISGRQGLDFGFAGCAKLAPTAVTPGLWQLNFTASTVPYVWDINFSSDTAIEWKLYHTTDNLTPTAILGEPIGPSVATAAICRFGAQVLASPAVSGALIKGGFCSANGYVRVLDKGWVTVGLSRQLVLVTSAVAANCYATMHWSEYTD